MLIERFYTNIGSALNDREHPFFSIDLLCQFIKKFMFVFLTLRRVVTCYMRLFFKTLTEYFTILRNIA